MPAGAKGEERLGDPKAELDVRLEAAVERCPEVVVLGLHTIEPLAAGTAEVRLRSLPEPA